MAGKDTMVLRGIDMWKGDYFKRKNQKSNALQNTPIHFLPKSEKTEDWKASVSDYYENIGLAKVSHSYPKVKKNRELASGILDMNDYRKTPKKKDFEVFQKAGVKMDIPKNEDINDFDFYPLIPNIVNLFTGYQLKRKKDVIFSTVDPFSRAAMFEARDQQFQATLSQLMMEMRDNNGDIDEQQAQQQLVAAQVKFKKYQDTAVEWANRVHKINYEKYNIRNLTNEAFKESYLCSSKVIFHINMMKDRFTVEHIDEAYAFHGVSPNSVDLTESGFIGWFRWMNIGDLLDNFGKVLKEEDIEKLKYVNTHYGPGGADLNLVSFWKNEVQDRTAEGGTAAVISAESYDPTRPYLDQPNEPLEWQRYREGLEKNAGLTFDGKTITQKMPDINPEFTYGEDQLFRVMYLYLESQRRIGWLTKIDRVGQITFQGWVQEDFIVTEEPKYDNSLLKERSVENLVYGEHIDWEWVPDWRRFITIAPNQTHAQYKSLGINLEKIYIDGNSLDFQFKNDQTPYGVKPPVVAMELKMRGVQAVPLVSLLKQDQTIYNICKNRVKFALRDDRGIQLVYPTNLIQKSNTDEQGSGNPKDDFERGLRKNKTIELNYDRQYLGMTSNQMSTPYTIDLSTVRLAGEYDQLAERIYYNALRTVGLSPQAAAEIKASEEVSNVQSAQQISQVQTEPLFNEYNNKLLPNLYTKMLEATQYYSTINEDFKLMYLNENDENTWLDITGVNLLHKDFGCIPKYSFDNEEFISMLKQAAMDNTLQESLSTRLEAVWKANENPAKVITMLREREEKAQENAMALEQSKQEQMSAELQHEQDLQNQMLDNENTQKQLDRESKERIAGLQKQIPQENVATDSGDVQMKNYLKGREIDSKDRQNQKSVDLQQRMHEDNVVLKQQELLQKDRANRMKLKESVANRNKYSTKSADRAASK